jgi:hypothetical protein
MNKLILAAAIALASVGAQAATLNLFGGTGQTQTGSVSSAGVQGGSAGVLIGVSGTQAAAGTQSNGAAQTTVKPSGVTSQQQSNTASVGGSQTGVLGLGGAGSTFGAQGISGAAAGGNFGTIGIKLKP